MTEAVASQPYKVTARKNLTSSIVEFTLVPEGGGEVPEFEPGAHITVETPSGAMRRYSLVNDGNNPENLIIAVKREVGSRGGSVSMHDDAQVGHVLKISQPENSFPLVPAQKYLLIAGGIGVTPILGMARHLKAAGKTFDFIYCTRTAEDAAYLDEVRALGPKVIVHHDNGELEKLYDFWDQFETPDAGHVYCCGPAPLMEEIKAVSGHWSEGRVHFEDFKGVDVVRADDTAFHVTLENTGQTIEIPADRSILEALREAGIHTTSSCESGTCGTCRCRLVSGQADHRDMVLMDEEKDSQIMICVSRAKAGDLVIAL
jgi:phthalate 4,5-dioxygenase reductase component